MIIFVDITQVNSQPPKGYFICWQIGKIRKKQKQEAFLFQFARRSIAHISSRDE